MSVTARIKEARTALGMSINKLADLVGVSSTAAWNWDHERTTPRAEQMVRIANALGVSKQWLLTGIDSEPAQQDSPAQILEEAKRRLAKALGVDPDKVRLDLSVSV